MYVYAYMHVCMYVGEVIIVSLDKHWYVYVLTVYMCIYVYIHICLYIYICMYVCVSGDSCESRKLQVHIYVYVHMCVYIYIFIYIMNMFDFFGE